VEDLSPPVLPPYILGRPFRLCCPGRKRMPDKLRQEHVAEFLISSSIVNT
jgi:hypothetical protein